MVNKYNENKRGKKKKSIIILLLIVLVVFLCGYVFYKQYSEGTLDISIGKLHYASIDNIDKEKNKIVIDNSTTKNDVVKKTEEEIIKEKKSSRKPEDILITSLGNIMFHGNQIKAANTGNGYDFEPSFIYIKNMVSAADLSLAVFEGSFVKDNYQGYPLFRTPDSVAKAISDAGVDVLNEASNHVFDGGESGMKRSRDIAKKFGMDVIGIKDDAAEDNFIVKDVKGYKFGLVAYTYETENIKGHRAVNGIPLTNVGEEYINSFNYNKLDDFYDKLNKQIEKMKKQEADYIIVSLHWGDEYVTSPNSYQKEIAKKLNSMGVDIILGNHPHVPQPYETIIGDDGHKTFVIYGQGNTLSNQSAVLLKEPNVEDGYIVNLAIHGEGQAVEMKDYNIVPIFLYRESKPTGLYYNRVIPDVQAIKDSSKFRLSNPSSAQQSLSRTEKIVGSKNIK